jgi:biotin carboxyl carrier protein
MAQVKDQNSTAAWASSHVWQPFYWSPSATARHSGIDLGMQEGTPLTAPMPGTIIGSSQQPWGGQVDELVTIGGQQYVLSFLHLSDTSQVQAGQQVQPGQVIGLSGSPPPGYGNGAHTHFELTHGSVPPYTGYSPHRPTSTSYPINPAAVVAVFAAGQIPTDTTSTSGSAASSSGDTSCGHNWHAGLGPISGDLCLDAPLDLISRAVLIFAGLALVALGIATFVGKGGSTVQLAIGSLPMNAKKAVAPAEAVTAA